MLRFVETRLFTRLADEMLGSGGLVLLQEFLLEKPDRGDVIPGSGGVRKLRWTVPGRGKQGGLRIIYYYRSRQGDIWLLTLYAKNEKTTIPGSTLRRIKEELDDDDNP